MKNCRFLLSCRKNGSEAEGTGSESVHRFADLDGLKAVNDNLGHEAGDNLIREMAETVKMSITTERIGMRYGGDEFVLFGRCKPGESEEKRSKRKK